MLPTALPILRCGRHRRVRQVLRRALSGDLRPGLPWALSIAPLPDQAIVQVPLATLTWYHNLTLFERVSQADQRLRYARRRAEQVADRNSYVTVQGDGLPQDRLRQVLRQADEQALAGEGLQEGACRDRRRRSKLVRALDAARIKTGMSKAELARVISASQDHPPPFHVEGQPDAGDGHEDCRGAGLSSGAREGSQGSCTSSCRMTAYASTLLGLRERYSAPSRRTSA